MTVDEVVATAWNIAENEQCDGVTFDAASDQWWVVTMTCLHGKYRGVSKGQLDVEAGFTRALEKFTEAHAGGAS